MNRMRLELFRFERGATARRRTLSDASSVPVLRLFIAGVSAAGCLAAAWSAPGRSGCILPHAAPESRIGRAQSWLHDPADRAAYGNRIDFLWSDDEKKPRLPNAYAVKYMMADRDPDKTHDVTWYRAHRPDWMMLKCDGSPAPMFMYRWGTFTSVDVHNPQVREYLLHKNLDSAMTGGRFDAVGVDNLNAQNVFARCGVDVGAGLRRDFSGQKRDHAYAVNLANWMQWLRQQVNARGLCLSGNDYFSDDNVDGFLAIADSLDIVVDEHGFTRNNKPSSLDGAWLRRMKAYSSLPPGKPLVVIDYPASTLQELTDAGVSWSMANFLLIKSATTYLNMTTNDQVAKWNGIPALDIKTGAPLEAMRESGGLFVRRFQHAVALVNPSSTRGGRYTLPPGAWRGLDGRTHDGSVEVPAATALVLTG